MNSTSAALTNVPTSVSYLKERLPHRRIDRLHCAAEVPFGILQAAAAKEMTTDREVLGQEWSTFLRRSRIKRWIRIRANTLGDGESVCNCSGPLKPPSLP